MPCGNTPLFRSSYLKQRKDEAKRRMEEERMAQLEKYREDYEAVLVELEISQLIELWLYSGFRYLLNLV